MSRAFVTCAALLAAALAPQAAFAGPNFEAVSVAADPAAAAGGSLGLIIIVRIDPGDNTQVTPYLTVRGRLDGAVALAPLIVPQPPVGRTVRIETQVPVPANVAGVFTVAAVLDAANGVAEDNELDNAVWASAVTQIRPQGPDPIITQVQAAQSRARPGDPLRVDVTVQNAGELAATVELGAYLSRNPELTPADPRLGTQSLTLPAGASQTVALTGVVPSELAAGSHVLGVVVDPAGLVAEVSEVNNTSLAVDPLVVYFDTLTLDTVELPAATLTQLFHVVLHATGGDGTYLYRVSQGSLPDGLDLSPTGVLSGTPTRSGTFDFTVELTSDGKADSRAYQVTVARSNAILTIATQDATQGFLNMPYEQLLLAGGGEPPYNWDLVAMGGVLPPGLDLSPAGLISGVPHTLGTFNFTVQVDDVLGNRDQRPIKIVVTSATNVIVLTQDFDPLPVGEPVDVAVVAAGGVHPYSWKGLSPPPRGLTLTEEGHLVGTPDEVGRWPFWVQVTDGSRAQVIDTALLQVEVVDAGAFEIEQLELPRGTVRSPYSMVISARGGQPPLRWSLATGSFLPDDFYLVPGDGVDAPEDAAFLYGLPILDGVHAFTVRVEDAFGRRREMTYALIVDRVVVDVASGCRCMGASGGSTHAVLALLFLGLLRVRRRRS